MKLVESNLVIVCKTDEISLKHAMKQIVIHVVVVARKQRNGCFNAYNGIKDAWKFVSDLIVFATRLLFKEEERKNTALTSSGVYPCR